MRDLDKELLSIKKQAAVVMFLGWLLGVAGCGMLLGIGGILAGFGFPAMWFGWFAVKNVIEVQALK